ncbi:MAG: VOC family protein [Polyangiaceae bacterium]
MNDLTISLAGLIFYSPTPDALVAFYRDALAVPLAPAEHGTVGPHFEGSCGGVHVAVWGEERHMSGPLVPVFRTRSLDEGAARVVEAGARQLHKAIDLGEGKRVAGFLDPDGRPLRLIEIDAPIEGVDGEHPRGARAVSAVVFASRDGERTAAFFERGLGVRFTRGDHAGDPHHEARLGRVRLAIVQGSPEGPGAVAPTFLADDLDALTASLHRWGVDATRTISLGPTKRLASFRDPDRNAFHAIEVRA